MQPLGLTEDEMHDLITFLHALTGEVSIQVLGPPLPPDAAATKAQ